MTQDVIEEAQNLLDAKASELEIIQWRSSKVKFCHQHMYQKVRLLTRPLKPCDRSWYQIRLIKSFSTQLEASSKSLQLSLLEPIISICKYSKYVTFGWATFYRVSPTRLLI